MGLGKWLRRKMTAIAIATASVEESTLKQTGGDLTDTTGKFQRHNQGSLADDLKQGVVTQQVQELRWRMYKVLEESQKHKSKVVGYDEDGFMITEQVKIEDGELGSSTLTKTIMHDTEYAKTEEAIENHYIYHPLELLVNNDRITLSMTDVLGEGKDKPERVLSCVRELRAKFEIEDYTNKMHVRTLENGFKILEFYVSAYPDEDNRKSRFFISEIKKAIKNPRMCDFLDITNVMFVSYNTVGVQDLMEFEYNVHHLEKIVEFDGNYIITFKAEVIKNGESLTDKFEEGADELIEKYKNNEKKDNGFN